MSDRWDKLYRDRRMSAPDAVRLVEPGDKVVFALGTAEPRTLGRALEERVEETGLTILHAAAGARHGWLRPDGVRPKSLRSIYIGPFERAAVRGRWLDYIPFSYGTAPRQDEHGRNGAYSRPDVYLVKVSPPDAHGYCSFGHSVWFSPACTRSARTVLAEVDPTYIRTYGDNRVHVSRIDAFVEVEPERRAESMPEPPPEEAGPAEVIGALTAELVQDGDVIQVGTGLASQAVLPFLGNHRDLGVHSELVFTEMVEMVQAGVITGRTKTVDTGKVVATCYVLWPGTPRQTAAASVVNENPLFELYDISYITNVPTISSMKNFVAINTALAIDLSGQVAVDTLGTEPYSGTGGALDFVVGANFAPGGRSIHAIPSTARGGEVSRIVPQFVAGAVPTIPRNYVDFVVTEHGVASLQGKTLRQRAEELIAIATPEFKADLARAAEEMFGA